MRKLILVSVILLTGQFIYAQQAPDFTVTDTDGQVHHLYADYLNQGKSVLIKIFFTTCPPCNSIAPLMEPFYQEWGVGEYDVEFFEITDKSFDTNSLVEAYAQNYGETFPAISVEGNAIATVQPYKNGMFGPWFGTPTFIVIAPDGTVQYDVDGPGNQATINAIDAALTATGAVKPGQGEDPVLVTGQVRFFQGSAGVGNALVQVVNASGNIILEETTNASGEFTLEILLSEVQPGWEVKGVKQGNPTNGVNTLDLIRIQKHLLNSAPFDNPLAKLAADANKSFSVSALDMIILLKLLLGITNNFPNNETWIVIPADTEFGPPNEFPQPVVGFTIPLQDILDGVRAAEFIGIKRGDVNGSANPNE